MDETEETEEIDDDTEKYLNLSFTYLGTINEEKEAEVNEEKELTNHHMNSRGKARQNLEREVQLLHKTMDLLQEQNAEMKRLIISSQRDAKPQ